ncbi:MAG: hypothetical protein O3C21_09825 [Verrucomicrobia bacterium]|nr:hypothetical protein [Verrucomicrobiota bacterium]
MELTSSDRRGVRRVVGRVCLRQGAWRFLTRFAGFVLIWCGIYLVLLLVSRLSGLIPDIFSMSAVLAVPGMALLSALLMHRATAPEDGARLIDEREQANDLFLTALQLRPQNGEFEPLVAERAEAAAAAVDPARIVPWRWDAKFSYAIVALAALVPVSGYTPQLDPFKKMEEARREDAREKKLEETRVATALQAQALEDKGSESRSEAIERELAKLEESFRAARPELKEQTRQSLTERQAEMGKMWKQLSDEKLRDALSKSKAGQKFGSQSPMRKKFREMAEDGKLSEVQKEMEKMKEELKDLAGKPDSADQRKKLDELKEKMQAMAEAMSETLGSDKLNKAMERALEQMDMANMPDLAQEAIKAMQESMELSKDELENLAEALKEMENLQQGLSAAQLAKALNEMGELNGEGEGDTGRGMSDYEKLFKEMMAGKGMGQDPGQGQGEFGGEGHGEGGKAPENPDSPTDFKSEKSKSALQKGKLLMNIKSKGQADVGEVDEAYKEAIGALREAASEAILQEQIPPGYHDSIRDYFDQMEQVSPN